MLDFDEILVTVNNPEIKKYLKESIKSYGVGNYRSAIIAVWIAAMFDLVKKFEILAEQQNEETVKSAWNNLKPIIEKHGSWENQLIESAASVAMLSKHEAATLQTLRQTRNRYAHPAFDETGSLFDPTPEEVRYFIRTLYDIVLSQPAQLGTFYVNQLLEKIKESNFFESELRDKDDIIKQKQIVGDKTNKINQKQLPRLAKELFKIIKNSNSKEHESNALCFISNIWGNSDATSEISDQISNKWNEHIEENSLDHTIVLESIIAYPACVNQLSIKSQDSIEECIKNKIKQKTYLQYSYANFLKYADMVPVAKAILDDLLNLIDIDKATKLYDYYQDLLGSEVFISAFGKSIYSRTREALKTGNGYIVNPCLDALCYCDIWKIASYFSEEEQKEFSTELIDSLNSNNFSTMRLLNFENRNNIPLKWNRLLLDSWIEKILNKKHLQHTLSIYSEQCLGLLDRHKKELGDYDKVDYILETILGTASNMLPSKSKLNLDDSEEAWSFLQQILLEKGLVTPEAT